MNIMQKPLSRSLPTAMPQEVGLSPERLAKLSDVMRHEVETKHVPGVSMLISRHGKVAYRENIGFVRPDGPRLRE
ncbi:MAG: serine hydrolase, partial [Hyphomicrobiales bacterium]|nr:serine hydrolase [Hyphomicrobiales bacterium]